MASCRTQVALRSDKSSHAVINIPAQERPCVWTLCVPQYGDDQTDGERQEDTELVRSLKAAGPPQLFMRSGHNKPAVASLPGQRFTARFKKKNQPRPRGIYYLDSVSSIKAGKRAESGDARRLPELLYAQTASGPRNNTRISACVMAENCVLTRSE